MTIQWVFSAMVWVARVVAHTEERATIAPTDRSIPPPEMTKVIPMLTTPMTEANRRIVRMLSKLANRSPPVATPTMKSTANAMTRPRLRVAELPTKRVSALGDDSVAAGLTISWVPSAPDERPGVVDGVSTLMRRLLS